ncbi:uncharacterized protein K452DRAFT_306362 [Aplosporella prunicola CBS 121167]|uniref:Oxidoreductase n=1 Tax=Aplosporella prunicola CBS 121167 TaxID=1176127 RepID=A0A6A6BKH6_9PEZI|nr:uncharacterized protein K452DRAFT_306362 [Aplosporella prunicola CBS 121167]KAF2144546.1 hypothetical protein K452DRAFT_306362 [Aplosporella prunicola CBS 121167]
MSPTALIIGATRGLGSSLAHEYLQKGYTVYGTARSPTHQDADSSKGTRWVPNVDISTENAGQTIASHFKQDSNSTDSIDVLIVSAGYFGKESFDAPDFQAQLKMYQTSAIGPVFLVQQLFKAGLLKQGSKVVLVSSESGSIGLRHESEGGGNYGHHASKAALNMVGKLLSLDLKDEGVAVAIVHPGFMRTEMTKSVGFDKFWDKGGAVVPEAAAKSLVEWVDTFDIGKTGQYWAPRGPGDIGTAEDVLGPKDKLSTPLQLPW